MIDDLGFRGMMYKLWLDDVSSVILYRIINPLADPKRLNVYPVVYGHGFTLGSKTMIARAEKSRPRKPLIGQPWVIDEVKGDTNATNDRSMPFMLSNNNFDVWLFESRGASSANRDLSVHISPGQANRFWNFSLDEQSLIDLPTVIDFVLNKTRASKVIEFGYSASTFYTLAMLSERPEYGDKLATAVLMAPFAYMSHSTGLTLPVIAAITKMIPSAINYDILPQFLVTAGNLGMKYACKLPLVDKLVCGNIIDSVGGSGHSQHKSNLFGALVQSTSLNEARHLAQLFESKRFRKYDFGRKKNMRVYGQQEPPDYNLTNIRFDRLVLARGLKDILTAPIDQERMIRELGKPPLSDIVVPDYNHFDFIDGVGLVEKVNAPVLRVLFNVMQTDVGPNMLRDVSYDSIFNPIYNESYIEIHVQPSARRR